MRQDDERRYQMPAELQKQFIPIVYYTAKEVSELGILPPLNETFLVGGEALMKRVNEEENEFYFEMKYVECLYFVDLIMRIQVILVATLPELKAKYDELDEKAKEDYHLSVAMIETIEEILPNIEETFPEITNLLENARSAAKEAAARTRTMNLDNKEVLNSMLLDDEIHGIYFLNLFTFFDFFIFCGSSDFSERVRESSFCCISDFEVAREKITSTVQAATNQKGHLLDFTLLDTYILFMTNHIFQKLFFSDAGDEVEEYFEKTKVEGVNATPQEIRNFMLHMSAALEKLLYKIAENEDEFQTLVQPVIDIEV